MPLSTELSASLREVLTHRIASPEMSALAPLLDLQSEWSKIPDDDELLVERTRSREGYHVFIFPFEGRQVHEGLSAVLAHRLAAIRPLTFTLSFNDYGIELLSHEAAPLEAALEQDLFGVGGLREDIRQSMNEAEMGRRQFREIARVARLVFQGFPGRHKTAAQIQASSGLLFDVFSRHDPDNPLLRQAREEVMSRQLEENRLNGALRRIGESRITIVDTPKISPFAFPIFVDRIGQHLSTEKLTDRIRRLQLVYEKEIRQ